MNYNTIEKVNPDVAKTLCARDYKGFGTGWDTMNGVIERRNNTTECKMLGMLGTEGFEKVRRVYATNALTPTISTKEDRIKILID